MTFIEPDEGILRITAFIGVLIVMIQLEYLIPRKARSLPRTERWITNTLLVVIDTVTLKLVMPVLAVAMATTTSDKGWGLLSLVSWPLWVEIILAIVVLDMCIYLQHWASHKVPILWRFHQVHHADRDIDVTTGLRFHPIEILFSMTYKLLLVVVLGPAAVAVILFEIILNASAMFNHSNVRLPLNIDNALRKIIVTPDMHRVHHSVIRSETDSNYGFFLSIWDRLYRTYIPQPRDGHDGMKIGLLEYQTNEPASITWSLLLPFKPKKASVQANVSDTQP
ncbi:MAG: sterol desaturase family protein [Gammaproteobacteria bacterium]|nr:sterol desaturase family protein [Gammaproteobacteria bacterium]